MEVTKNGMMIALLSWCSRRAQGSAALFSSRNINSSAINSKPTDDWKEAALAACEALSTAQSLLFVTGAGISAESGLPTYRGVSGLYNANDGMTEDGDMTIEECLSGYTYAREPALTWKYLMQIERACRGAKPSKAHRLLAAAEKKVDGQVTVITQNVDGLHDRAGSTDVIPLHGHIYHLKCPSCGSYHEVDSYAHLEQQSVFPPPCDKCPGNLRPDVVLFDEFLSEDTVQRYNQRLGLSSSVFGFPTFHHPYDVSIAIGTTALFGYVQDAALCGKKTIEINPDPTSLTDVVDIRIASSASEALDFIFHELGWQS